MLENHRAHSLFFHSRYLVILIFGIFPSKITKCTCHFENPFDRKEESPEHEKSVIFYSSQTIKCTHIHTNEYDIKRQFLPQSDQKNQLANDLIFFLNNIYNKYIYVSLHRNKILIKRWLLLPVSFFFYSKSWKDCHQN